MSLLRKIGYFSAFIIPALWLAGYLLGGPYQYLSLVFVFIFIPLIDRWVGIDPSNPDQKAIPDLAGKRYYRFVLYTWTWVQFGLLFAAFYFVTRGTPMNFTELAGFTLGFSLVSGGIGITVAHELGHKKAVLQRFYSKLLLLTVSYMHFYIEHNKGHHVHVATPRDPATARRGESFYRFWFRSVFGGYLSAWHIEAARLRRRGRTIISPYNQMIWFTLLPFLFVGVVTTVFRLIYGIWYWEIPVFFFAQSILGFTLLELVNYVEHYGILRREEAPGRFERVNETHSWNASHLVSNFFLFQLQRHSDHHMHAIKPYQVLLHHDASPQLPAGYPTMIILALFPPLWFRLMDGRLARWEENCKISVASY